MLLQKLLLVLLACLAAGMKSGTRTRSDLHNIQLEELSETRMRLTCLRDNIERVRNARWTKDGLPFNEMTALGRVSITSRGVTVDPVLLEDEGEYRCNDGVAMELTVPPHVNQTELSIMQDLGSTFTIPCGITLGPVSKTKTYEVTWQRIFGRSFSSVGSCHYTDPSELHSPEDDSESCRSIFGHSISLDDLSLTVYNFCISNLAMIYLMGPQVTYKCRVEQLVRPSFNRYNNIKSVHTVVSFQYELVLQLPSYSIVQKGENVTLQIEFQEYSLSPSGVEWTVNGLKVSGSLSSDTLTTSSLFLSSDSVEQGAVVMATVNIHHNSTVSTATTLIVISPIDEVIVTQCDNTAPVIISFNIPATIPIPRGSSSSPAVQLHIEYTRIDRVLADSDAGGEKEVFTEKYDADELTRFTHMEARMRSLPYMLVSWKMYVLRVRLEIMEVISRQWSPYSHPVCIRCEDCLNPSGVEMNLQLSFPENSYACSNTVIEETKESLIAELVQVIQESCPDYLCQDLVFTDVVLNCPTTDSTAAEISGLVSGVGTQDSVRAFLNNLASQQEPLNLNINGTSVGVMPIASPTGSVPQSHDVAPIAGPSGGGFTAVLLIAALILACAVWRWKRNQKRSSESAGRTAETVGHQPTLTQPETPALTLSEARPSYPASPLHHSMNTGIGPLHLPTPPPSENEPSTPHRPAVLQLYHAPYHTPAAPHFPSSSSSAHVPPSALTMREAADLVQLEENLDDAASMDFSEFSFISDESAHSHYHLKPLLLSATPTHSDTPTPHGTVYTSRDIFHPLSPSRISSRAHVPSSTCSCSCHSSEHICSPSPSMSLLDTCRQIQNSPTLRRKLAASSASVISQLSDFQHHYRLWTDRGRQMHHHLAQKQAAAGSPV